MGKNRKYDETFKEIDTMLGKSWVSLLTKIMMENSHLKFYFFSTKETKVIVIFNFNEKESIILLETLKLFCAICVFLI